MAIRTQRISETASKPRPENWQFKLEAVNRKASKALVSEDLSLFEETLSEVSGFSDPHRALQADLLLLQLLSLHQSKPAVWSRFYLAFSEHLYAQLQKNPLEPERFNGLGVALYELGETKAAAKCFSALERLYPEHHALLLNKRAVKARRKAGTPKRPFSPDVITALRALSGKVTAIAEKAVLPDPEEQKLSLAMIVRDEEEMLPDCLASVEGLVDEIIIVDTGSTDRTRQIAEAAGAKVLDFEWNGSFSDARNVSLEAASGDWILQLDADERLLPEEAAKLRSLLSRTYCEGFTMLCTNYTGQGGAGATVMHAPLRVWKNLPEYRFEGVIHEQKTANMPHYLTCRFQSSDLRILHFGYLKEVIQDRDKSQRNLRLLEKEAEQNPTPFTYFNLGNEYAQLDNPARAADYYKLSFEKLSETDGFLKVGYAGMLAKGLVRQSRLAGLGEEAQELCAELQGLLPKHTDLVLEEGYLAQARGDFEAAARSADRALALGDSPAEMCGVVGAGSFLALSLKGEVLEARGEFSAAASLYRKSLEEFPSYLTPLGTLARSLLRAGEEPAEVFSELSPLAAKSPSSAGLLLAHSFYEAEAIEQAEELYQDALSASPSSVVARLGLIECALSRASLQEAIELCGDPQEGQIGGDALLRSKLFCLLSLGLYDEAESALNPGLMSVEDLNACLAWAKLGRDGEAVKLSAPSALSLISFLPALLKLKLTDAAEIVLVLSSISSLPPRDRIELSAEAFLLEGYLDSAAEAWLEAIDSLGADPQALYGLARISLSQGRRDEAKALAGDALSLDPEFIPADRLLRALQ